MRLQSSLCSLTRWNRRWQFCPIILFPLREVTQDPSYLALRTDNLISTLRWRKWPIPKVWYCRWPRPFPLDLRTCKQQLVWLTRLSNRWNEAIIIPAEEHTPFSNETGAWLYQLSLTFWSYIPTVSKSGLKLQLVWRPEQEGYLYSLWFCLDHRWLQIIDNSYFHSGSNQTRIINSKLRQVLTQEKRKR